METTQDLQEKYRKKLNLPSVGEVTSLGGCPYMVVESNTEKAVLRRCNGIPPFFFLDEDFDIDQLM